MKTILYIIIVMAFVACTDNKQKVIKFTESEIKSLGLDSVRTIEVQEDSAITIDLNRFLKKGEFNFGELIESIYVVPLETTDNSLIGSVITILATDSNIYVQDEYKGSSIAIFDNRGNFVKRIDRGQGPEDVFDIKSITFDKFANELIIFHNHFFSFFTPDGQYKRRDRIPLNAHSVEVLPDGYLFHSINGLNNNHINPDIEYLILTTDKKYKLKSVGFPYQYSKDNIYGALTSYIYLNSGEINFTFQLTNAVYQYTDDYNMILKYRLDINDKTVPDKLLHSDYHTLMSRLENNNYFIFLGEYAENHRHNFIKLINLYSRDYTYIYRDKVSGHCIGGNNVLVDRALYVPLNPPYSSFGKYFVSCYLPGDEFTHFLTPKNFSENEVKMLKSLSGDDNPVIVFYELKDF